MPMLAALALLTLASSPASPPVDGYALFRYAPPGWHWELAPTPTPVASAATKADGACRITFAVPTSALPGLVPDRARFGVAAGFIANGPITWFPLGGSFERSADLSPPLADQPSARPRFSTRAPALTPASCAPTSSSTPCPRSRRRGISWAS